MFFFFQTDSTSYFLSHLVNVEHYRTEKAQLFHWLYDFDNCTYCNFSSLLSIWKDPAMLFYPLCDLLAWHSFVFALKPGTKNWTRQGCVGKERPGLLQVEHKAGESGKFWSVTPRWAPLHCMPVRRLKDNTHAHDFFMTKIIFHS